MPAAASPVKQAVAKEPANKRCSSKVDIIRLQLQVGGGCFSKLSLQRRRVSAYANFYVYRELRNICNAGFTLLPHSFQRILMLKYFLRNTPF